MVCKRCNDDIVNVAPFDHGAGCLKCERLSCEVQPERVIDVLIRLLRLVRVVPLLIVALHFTSILQSHKVKPQADVLDRVRGQRALICLSSNDLIQKGR